MSSESLLQPLTLKYRPRTFNDMVGQRAARVTLTQMIVRGRIPPALLLHGSWGSGKTSSARIVAAALNCEAEEASARPCGGCGTCAAVVEGKSSDVIEIDAASSGLAEDMRELRQQVRFQPLRRYRVVILDEVHELTVKGQQTLLKVLEEPPPRVVFLLATTNVDRLLPTVASRCFSVRFARITLSDIVSRLAHIAKLENYSVSRDLLVAIADRSQGAMRDAVMLLDQCMLVGLETPEQLSVLLGDSDVSVRIVTALSKSDYPAAFEAAREGLEALPSPSDLVARLVTTLRRLLVLSSLQGGSGEVPLAPPPTEAERALAPNLAPVRLVAALRVVWDYYRSVVPTADAFAAMDLIVVMLGQALSGPSTAGSPRVSATLLDTTLAPNTSVGSSSPAETVDDILAMVSSPMQ